jgi:hypothetical protein
MLLNKEKKFVCKMVLRFMSSNVFNKNVSSVRETLYIYIACYIPAGEDVKESLKRPNTAENTSIAAPNRAQYRMDILPVMALSFKILNWAEANSFVLTRFSSFNTSRVLAWMSPMERLVLCWSSSNDFVTLLDKPSMNILAPFGDKRGVPSVEAGLALVASLLDMAV